MDQGSNKHVVIGIVAVTVLIFGGLTYLVARSPSSGVGPQVETGLTFSDTDNPSVGPADAKVTVQIYSDFQCPACRASEPILQQMIQQYKDRVRFVWNDFPLEGIHKNARLGANAVRCAQAQGKYFEMHDHLFAEQDMWVNAADPKSTLVGYAQGLGLDKAVFEACLNNRSEDAKVAADIREGNGNRVDSTPTFLINNVRYNGMNAADWQAALNAALAK